MAEEFTKRQRLLMRIRDDRCGGNAAELARKIKKDATYVNRLLYPIGKKGGKGVGLEIMDACNKAFKLPPGYWDGPAPPAAQELTDKGLYWPFKKIPIERFEALEPEDKGYVQRRLLQAIQECEAEFALTLSESEERLVAEAHRPKLVKERKKTDS